MTPVLTTHRAWYRRAFDALRCAWPRSQAVTPLHKVDCRTLADIGVHSSELSSIEAESRVRADLTRLRIVSRSSLG